MAIEFSQEFVARLALGFEPTNQVCRTFGVTPDQLAELYNDHNFQCALAGHTRYVMENGITNRLRVEVVLSHTIQRLHDVIEDPEASSKERMDAIEMLMKYSQASSVARGRPARERDPDGDGDSAAERKAAAASLAPPPLVRPSVNFHIELAQPPVKVVEAD